MTGYRAFSPLFVKSFPIISQGFEIETEMTIHALNNNLLITSVPVLYRDRPSGSESKLNTYTDGAKVLLTIFNLYRYYKPLRFFSTVAIIMLCLSVGFFLPVLAEYYKTGMVLKIPTVIVSSITMLFSALLFSCGLILDTQSKNSRKNFEIYMNLFSHGTCKYERYIKMEEDNK